MEQRAKPADHHSHTVETNSTQNVREFVTSKLQGKSESEIESSFDEMSYSNFVYGKEEKNILLDKDFSLDDVSEWKRLLRKLHRVFLPTRDSSEKVPVEMISLTQDQMTFNSILRKMKADFKSERLSQIHRFEYLVLYKIRSWIEKYNAGNFRMMNEEGAALLSYLQRSSEELTFPLRQQDKSRFTGFVAPEAAKLLQKFEELRSLVRRSGTGAVKIADIHTIQELFKKTEDTFWEKEPKQQRRDIQSASD